MHQRSQNNTNDVIHQIGRPNLLLGCILIGTPILFCGFLLSLPVTYHNTKLDEFADNLYEYPLPSQTTVISTYETVGLIGNSNHCDFYAEQTMTTKLTRQEVENYYQNIELPAVGFENERAFIHVEFDESTTISDELIFKISVLDYGNPTNLDFRCH